MVKRRGHARAETSHPPRYYVPRADLADEAQLLLKERVALVMKRVLFTTICASEGEAALAQGAAWAYRIQPNAWSTHPMGGQILALGRAKALEDLWL